MLTERQAIFVKYLVDQIGFSEGDFLQQYLNELVKQGHSLAHLAAFRATPSQVREYDESIQDFMRDKYTLRNGFLIPRELELIDLLLLERDIKKDRKFRERAIRTRGFSATDVANFTYCPVSFSLSRSFDIVKPISAEIGSFLHKQHRLARFVEQRIETKPIVKPEQVFRSQNIKIKNPAAQEMIDDLDTSYAVFLGSSDRKSGHSFFTSTNGQFFSQPDYIFFNNSTQNYFVVEEKFQWIPDGPSRRRSKDEAIKVHRKRNWLGFYESHINQLRSYLYGIPDYALAYGYLTYWEYTINAGQPSVEQCKVEKIASNEMKHREVIREIAKDILNVLRYHGGEFDIIKRTPSKCAGCVYGVLCGHKTGRFETFDYPYSKKHMRLEYVPFPEQLRKPKEDSD